VSLGAANEMFFISTVDNDTVEFEVITTESEISAAITEEVVVTVSFSSETGNCEMVRFGGFVVESPAITSGSLGGGGFGASSFTADT
jgi:hypothetical protein